MRTDTNIKCSLLKQVLFRDVFRDMMSPRPRTEDEENESFLVQIDDEPLTENTRGRQFWIGDTQKYV